MSKEDFIVIAEIIKSMPKSVRMPLMLVACQKLKAAYPNFDPITFQDYVEGK